MNDRELTFPGNFRIHIGLAVADVTRSMEFYSALFGEPPVKIRPGYAKFEPVDPSVNLSLNQVSEVFPRNAEAHFGIQVKTGVQLANMTSRLKKEGLQQEFEHQVTCCYAVQDKMWVRDPDGNAWEVFLVTQDDPVSPNVPRNSGVTDCCRPNCCERPVESEQPQSVNSTRQTVSSTCCIETRT